MRNSYSYHRLYDMKKENQNMELFDMILNSMSKEISDASTSKISKEEFESIKMIYHNILFAYSDHEYLSVAKSGMTKAAFIDQNQTFFKRVKYYLYHFIVIELNKVFHHKETYFLNKYINYELKDLSNNDLLKYELNVIKDKINLKPNKKLLEKINTIRNSVSAHLDSDRQKLTKIKI